MPHKPQRPRRRLKKAALRLLGLVVVLAVLVAMAPTLVSWGVGQGVLLGRLEKHLNGSVALDRLGLAWFGPQYVDHLVITDAGGDPVANLDLRVSAGLFDLLFGRTDALAIELSGKLEGELHEDGSTSFKDLLASSSAPEARRGPGGKRSSEPFALDGVPAVTVSIDGLTVELRDNVSRQTIGFRDLAGELSYRPGDRVAVDVRGKTTSNPFDGSRGETQGSVVVTGEIRQLFDRDGVLTLERASGRINLELRNVAVPLADRDTSLQSLTVTAASDDLTKELVVSIEADAVINGSEAGRLEGTLTALRPVSPDGTWDVSLDRITGSLHGRSVPTALLQPLLSNTPFLATRDLGPTIDLDAEFPGGVEEPVTLTAEADAFQLTFSGRVNPDLRSIDGDRLRLSVEVAPELFTAATGMFIEEPMTAQIDLSAFTIPPIGDDPLRQLRHASATGTVTVSSPIAFSIERGGPPLVLVENVVVQLHTAALGESVGVQGTATIEGADASFDFTVSHLFGADGSFTLDEVEPVGTASVRGIDAATLAQLLPDQAKIIEVALDGPVDVMMVTMVRGAELGVMLHAATAALNIEVAANRRAESWHIAKGRGTITVTPPLAAILQDGSEAPIVLARTAVVTFELDPFDLPRRPSERGMLGDEPIRARMTASAMVLDQVPGFAEPVGLRDLSARITAWLGEQPSYSVQGQTQLHRATPAGVMIGRAGSVRFDLAGLGREGETQRLTLEVTDLSVPLLEQMLGKARGAISQWLGDKGSVTATLDGAGGAYRVSVGADFPHLAGDFEAMIDERMIEITAREPRLSLSREAIQRRLAAAQPPAPGPARRGARRGVGRGFRPGARPAARPVAPMVTVEADVPLTLTINRLRVPRAILNGRPFDAAAVDLDVTMTGGPLVLRDVRGARTSIDGLRLAFRSHDLDKGLDLSMSGRVSSTGDVPPGRLELSGTLTGLMNDEKVLSTDRAQLDLTAHARGIPTVVVDGFAGMKGLLVATVGDRMDGEATARRFTRTSGTLDIRVEAPNGWIDGKVLGHENALRIGATPIKAELEITPPLCKALLYKIHPVLADIRSTEQPLRVTVSRGTIPLDGDVSRLDADIAMTIGAVQIDSGSVSLALLTLFNASNAQTIEGFIEPISVRIRKGVVTYERFAVQLDRYTLVYSGSIDLNTRTADLRTEMPLAGLAMSVRELRGYADQIIVPLVTRGPLDNLKTEIDPDFDLAGAAFEAGFRGLLNEVLKDEGIPLGDILEGIFGGKKKRR